MYCKEILLGFSCKTLSKDLYKRKILQVDSPEGVFHRPNSKFVAEFVGVKNLFRGMVSEHDGLQRVDLGKIQIDAITQKRGEVWVTIRPEDILLSKYPIGSSARNNFKGEIISFIDKGPLVQVDVQVGKVFSVLVTNRSFEELRLETGMLVYISFKTASAHVI
jgi:molybdopterin-binding protein